MRRQEVLEKGTSLLNLVIVLDESVLMRQYGDESVMYEQLQSLADRGGPTKHHPANTATPRPHPVSAESFVIFSFGPKDNAILHDVVAAEALKASFYIENQQETYLHLLVFNTLLEAALDAAASRDLILQTAESHWRGSP